LFAKTTLLFLHIGEITSNINNDNNNLLQKSLHQNEQLSKPFIRKIKPPTCKQIERQALIYKQNEEESSKPTCNNASAQALVNNETLFFTTQS